MSSNNDTPMTRFLLAILQQKNLKDIDWNKVAQDPILPQAISNGHAARMRYSRFKNSILGTDTQKRNPAIPNKNRVMKSKKDGKVKRAQEGPDNIKDDPDSQTSQTSSSTRETATKVESPHVKYEMPCPNPEMPLMKALFSPTSAPMPTADMRGQFQARLLTPCSDSDALGATSSYGASPTSDMLHAESPFDFAAASSSPCTHTHEHLSWSHAPAYSSYGVNFDLNSYPTGPCDHQHSQMGGGQLSLHQHTQLSAQDFGVNPHSQLPGDEVAVGETPLQPNQASVMVKHEHWDDGGL